jgi:hypothetical protein
MTPAVPTLDVVGKPKVEKRELDDDDLLIASPIVYGFSLSDKVWREYPPSFVTLFTLIAST